MSPDLSLSRRAALKLAAWGGAGLVVSACTDRVRSTTPEGSLRPTTPEQVPLPGRPPNVRVSHDHFVAHAEPCLAVNPRNPRNLLGACIAYEAGGGSHIGAYASFDAGVSWRSLGGLTDSANGAGDGPERQVAALGGRVTRQLGIIDGFVARLPAPAVGRLQAAAGVRAVTVDALLAPLDDDEEGWDDQRDGDEHTNVFDAAADLGSLANVAKMIGADDLHQDRITGRGVDVALVDTGVVPVQGLQGADKLVHGADLSFESQANTLRYLDTNGHGTHMAGIIAGRDPSGDRDDDEGDDDERSGARRFHGVAPDARLVNVKVGAASGATDVSQVLAAIDWVVAHKSDNGLNIRVLNLSFGDRRGPGLSALRH